MQVANIAMGASPDSSQALVPSYHLIYLLLAGLVPLFQLLIKEGREGITRTRYVIVVASHFCYVTVELYHVILSAWHGC